MSSGSSDGWQSGHLSPETAYPQDAHHAMVSRGNQAPGSGVRTPAGYIRGCSLSDTLIGYPNRPFLLLFFVPLYARSDRIDRDMRENGNVIPAIANLERKGAVPLCVL